ncbi:MAG: hypothetical protein NW224_08325 [Leptolyngbyaceae cyanobacterium bins.302]|nr:hypothetical protein [Leptolyngbyaceae cyanobacterium bins.302]
MWEGEDGRDVVGAIAKQRRLTRRCNGLSIDVGGVTKALAAVELSVSWSSLHQIEA